MGHQGSQRVCLAMSRGGERRWQMPKMRKPVYDTDVMCDKEVEDIFGESGHEFVPVVTPIVVSSCHRVEGSASSFVQGYPMPVRVIKNRSFQCASVRLEYKVQMGVQRNQSQHCSRLVGGGMVRQSKAIDESYC